MAKLISLYRDDTPTLGKRELPIHVDENVSMVMRLPDIGVSNRSCKPKGSDFDAFSYKCTTLSQYEFSKALVVSSKDVFNILGQSVPCVGCRRSVERLYWDMVESKHTALHPVTLLPDNLVSISQEYVGTKSSLYSLLCHHGSRLNKVSPSQGKGSRQTRRCGLHSLESHRNKGIGWWRSLWDSMAPDCKEEMALLESEQLLETLEAYLQKHRFCPECRLKVHRAFNLLMGEKEGEGDKGFKPILYLGLKACPAEKHLHIQSNVDYLALLLARAEPEMTGGAGRRERHAKSMEIAQEEVVTCVGICLLERLQRLNQRVKEEEQAADLLLVASLAALKQSFEIAVENKRGVSQLELLCEELSREEEAEKQRKEQKRLKRRKRRGKKEMATLKANVEGDEDEEDAGHGSYPVSCEEKCVDEPSQLHCTADKKLKNQTPPTTTTTTVETSPSLDADTPCPANLEYRRMFYYERNSSSRDSYSPPPSSTSPPPTSRDSGYACNGFGTGHSCDCSQTSPEGSDIACGDGLCCHDDGKAEEKCGAVNNNVEEEEEESSTDLCKTCGSAGRTLSLQQMLEESCSCDGDDEDAISYIPDEEVAAFKNRLCHVTQERQRLRNVLKQRFALLCQQRKSDQDFVQL